MDMQVIIDQIDAQIAKLQQVRTLLADAAAPIRRKPGRPSLAWKAVSPATADIVGVKKVARKSSPRRTLSTEARQKIAAAQTLRWAKSKAASEKAAKNPVREAKGSAVAKPTKPKTATKKTAPVKKAIAAKKAAPAKVATATVASI